MTQTQSVSVEFTNDTVDQSISDICNMFASSPSSLFKTSLGCPFTRWITDLRKTANNFWRNF